MSGMSQGPMPYGLGWVWDPVRNISDLVRVGHVTQQTMCPVGILYMVC